MQFNVPTDYKRDQPMASENEPCTGCGGEMVVRTSNSAKNPGRDFWACPNRCQGIFGGWVDQGTPFSQTPAWKKQKQQRQQQQSPAAGNGAVMQALAALNQKIDSLRAASDTILAILSEEPQ